MCVCVPAEFFANVLLSMKTLKCVIFYIVLSSVRLLCWGEESLETEIWAVALWHLQNKFNEV